MDSSGCHLGVWGLAGATASPTGRRTGVSHMGTGLLNPGPFAGKSQSKHFGGNGLGLRGLLDAPMREARSNGGQEGGSSHRTT
jgi:hypothetical protein